MCEDDHERRNRPEILDRIQMKSLVSPVLTIRYGRHNLRFHRISANAQTRQGHYPPFLIVIGFIAVLVRCSGAHPIFASPGCREIAGRLVDRADPIASRRPVKL
jgi:hypothetical protein